jgi:hypothetical protein
VLHSHLVCAAREIPLNSSFVVRCGECRRKDASRESAAADASGGGDGHTACDGIHGVTDSDGGVTAEGLLPANIDPIAFARRNAAAAKASREPRADAKQHTSSSASSEAQSHTSVCEKCYKFSDASLFGENFYTGIEYLAQTESIVMCRESYELARSRSNAHAFRRSKADAEKLMNSLRAQLKYIANPLFPKPTRDLSLRLVDPVTVLVVDDSQGGVVIDSLGYSRAFYELFEGAIYMHRAQQYIVLKLDLATHKAHCRPTRVDYYTSCRNKTTVIILNILDSVGHFKVGSVTVIDTVSIFTYV